MSLLLLEMKININIPPHFIHKVLDEHGYVSETVTLYYNENDNDLNVNLKPVLKHVAYPSWRRPKGLDDEHPMVDDFKGIFFDKVVEELFNNWLIETLSAHHRPIRD